MRPNTSKSKLARAAVYVAAAWLVVWAGMKLFVGSPQSLPEPVRDFSPFDSELTFRLAIALELAIFCLALLKPHLGWAPLAGLYAFFVVLLVPMVAAGAETCGCGGGAIQMSPILMLTVDAALLVGILATRPWKRIAGPGLSTILLALGIAASFAAPWLVIRSAGAGQGDIVVDAETGKVTSGGAAVRYVNLEPETWKGLVVHDIAELGAWIPAESLPIEGSIVFWRQGCDVCAVHLRELAAGNDGSRQILLVQVRDDLKNSRAVDALPEGSNVIAHALPEGVEFVLTTPCEVVVAGGTVTNVLTGDEVHPQ